MATEQTADRTAESFRGILLRHRGRTGLTQAQLAARVGVSRRSVQDWEAGLNYPDAQHLQALIAAFLEAGGLTVGGEATEAEALWAAALTQAPRMQTPFDPALWADVLARRVGPAVQMRPPDQEAIAGEQSASRTSKRGQDWGQAPDVLGFVGRAEELTTLRGWVLQEHCRLVALVGMGGIGKTILAARLAQDVAPTFQRVYWRSLRDALPVTEWLAGAIGFLSGQQLVPPEGEAARLTVLLQGLRDRPSLLVLDNFETVLEPGEREGRYRDGFAGYGRLLQVLGETTHQSCLMVTSREAPPELAVLGSGAERTLQLIGLGTPEGKVLLADKQLWGNDQDWANLISRFGGNGLALKVVGESIHQVFGGDIGAFLQEVGSGTVFGGMRRLLAEQLDRSSVLEQRVLRVLAVEREPITMAELLGALGPRVGRAALIETFGALRRRSLVERAEVRGAAAFMLQSVVLEYVTDRLVQTVSDEITRGQPVVLVQQPLINALAKDYVRQSQERLIGDPTLQQLQARHGGVGTERLLLAMLEGWRGRPPMQQGFGPGNVVNLLRLMRGDLNGLDFSHLCVRQAYLQDVDAHDASLEDAQVLEVVLGQAFDSPSCVALSADGAYLVAGTSRGTLSLWALADQTLLFSITAHSAPIHRIALSDDAQLVTSSSVDASDGAKVWAVPSGRLVAVMREACGAWGVALSADNQTLATGHLDHTVRLWETQTGRLLRTLEGHTSTVYGVALSADGQLVVSSSGDGTLKVWDVVTGRLLRTLQSHTAGLRNMAVSTDGQIVASASLDGTVKLWDVRTGELLMTYLGNTAVIYGVALAGDWRLLACSSADGLVRVWDAASGRLLATLQGHTAAVWSVALSRDGDVLASGSEDGTIKLWEPESGRLLTTLKGRATPLSGVALSDDGQRLVCATQDGSIKLWDVESGRLQQTWQKHTTTVRGVALSGDGRLVASGSRDHSVKVWDIESGRLVRTLEGHTSGVNYVALSGDAQVAASSSYDGTVKLWDVHSGRLLASLPHQSPVVGNRNVALSGNGKVLATGGPDGLAKLWDAQTGEFLTTFRGDASAVWCVALTADGQRVAVGHENGSLECWDARQGRMVATMVGHSGLVLVLALSMDGQLLISGSVDRTVGLWDTRSGSLRLTLTGHTGPVWSVALSADSRLVASAGADGTVKLWEASGGVCLRTLWAERRYERMDITGLTGVTEAQRNALVALGAVDRNT